jgi:hypothetical protein
MPLTCAGSLLLPPTAAAATAPAIAAGLTHRNAAEFMVGRKTHMQLST